MSRGSLSWVSECFLIKCKMMIQESKSGIVCFPQSAFSVDFATMSFLPEDSDQAFLDEYNMRYSLGSSI